MPKMPRQGNWQDHLRRKLRRRRLTRMLALVSLDLPVHRGRGDLPHNLNQAGEAQAASVLL